MKNLTTIVETQSKINKINVGNNTINYISSADLKKYLELANKVLSPNTKYVIQYLIDHNNTYISELESNEDNVLAGFYNNGRANASDKDLWDNIYAVVKSGRYREIPVFFTEEEFNHILKKERPAEYFILSLDTEAGRNNTAKQYQPLVMKIAHQFNGKSNMGFEDLVQEGNKGLHYAMQQYGLPKRAKKDENGNDQDVTKLTFGQYAAWIIRNFILDGIKELSHLVKIPVSQQRKEKAETGKNTRSYSISGDKTLKHGDDGNKSLFDFIGQVDDASANLDQEDIQKSWNKAFELIEKNFDKKTMDIFYAARGLNGHKKVSNKDLAKKYKCAPSQITYFCNKVVNFILTNKQVKNLLTNVYELMKECQNDIERNTHEGPYYINTKQNISLDE